MASTPPTDTLTWARRDDPVEVLWSLLATPTIDPHAFAWAIENALGREDLDWRTIQLIKEGWESLEHSEGAMTLEGYLDEKTPSEIAETIRTRTAADADGHDEVRFPSLKERLVPPLSPAVLRQFLRELGARLGLRVTHFQGHSLPDGWAGRTTDAGTFGRIHLRLIDPIDIIAGKVYSPRTKDLDDFRVLCEVLDREALRDRVVRGLPSRWADPEARSRAIRNWYIAYGEQLADE